MELTVERIPLLVSGLSLTEMLNPNLSVDFHVNSSNSRCFTGGAFSDSDIELITDCELSNHLWRGTYSVLLLVE